MNFHSWKFYGNWWYFHIQCLEYSGPDSTHERGCCPTSKVLCHFVRMTKSIASKNLRFRSSSYYSSSCYYFAGCYYYYYYLIILLLLLYNYSVRVSLSIFYILFAYNYWVVLLHAIIDNFFKIFVIYKNGTKSETKKNDYNFLSLIYIYIYMDHIYAHESTIIRMKTKQNM